ncbi:MAG: chitobiase/beta-hexosaminidase C-terminal domain-containing protein [Bacteroidales bacterium]|nr:chitobiase/beta-hexosaminidase C-terminal domain-containing protein [Bacteroidales bacterium]
MKKFYWIKSILAVALVMVFAANQTFAEKGWQRVTHETTLAAGDTIIIAAANFNYAISTNQKNNNRDAAAITKTGDIATFTSSVQVFVLETGETTGSFHIVDFDDNGGYLYAPGTGNHLKTSTTVPGDNAGDWVITIFENDSITITSQHATATQVYMRYNNTNGSNLFSCYTSGSSIIQPVTIYKYAELADVTVEAPVFNPAAGTYYSEQEVALTCATAGATILYTTDGSDPVTNGTIYTEPFTVSTTTTVKAVAYVGSDHSHIITTVYTFPTEVANIAAFKAASTSSQATINLTEPYVITNDVNFVFSNGTYMYVEDETAGLLIYNNPVNITTEYVEGDIISGGIVGTYSKYQNQIEMKPLLNTDAASENIGITPTVVTIADLKANYAQYDARLVTIENVTFTHGFNGSQVNFHQDGDSLDLYNRFNIDTTLVPGTVTNITGFAAIYGSGIQIYPRTNADLQYVEPVPQPAMTILSPADGSVFSTLDTIHVDVNIENFSLQSDGYIKAESELLIEAGLPNPVYFNFMTWAFFTQMPFSPLPAGEHSVTLTLVGLDSLELSPSVSKTVNFTVVAPTAEAPVFTPTAGTYADSVVVSLGCATANAEIHYTVDGTEPTDASTLYTGSFTLTDNATVKAKAFMHNVSWNDSPVTEATYTIAHEAMMNVTPENLAFSSTETTGTIYISSAFLTNDITLSCDNAHFTLSSATVAANTNTSVTVTFDATEPAMGSITLSSSLNDDVLTREVQLSATALLPAPVITPADGTTDTLIEVAISSNTADAIIYYTMDGSEPTDASDVYSSPITLNVPGTYTVKAIAMAENWENSTVASATFTVVEPVIPSIDTIMYSTGFEASEGFVAATQYQNAEPVFTGNANQQWGTVFGTPTTTDHICGAQSMQMRWYTSHSTLGYTFTNFDIRNVTYVTFVAKNNGASNGNGLNVIVSYSIDGGNNFIGDSVITLSSNKANYRYNVSETGEFDFVRLRFAVSMPETTPANASRLTIDSVVVFGVPGVISHTVEIPVISPNGGVYYEAFDVSMTCPTEGATIRYTLDGTEPTETSTEYTTPVNINATTTVKAKAWKDGMTASFVATQVFNFPPEVPNIAAFKAANSSTNSTVYKITGNVNFVFRSEAYMFVEDETAGLLIYDNRPVISTEYEEGDIISNGVFGTYSLYNGMVEMVPVRNTETASGTVGPIVPMNATINEIITSYNLYESRLVTIDTVTFISETKFVKGNDTLQITDRFNALDNEITAGMMANVTGFVAQSNGTIQLYPRNDNDIVEIEPVSIGNVMSERVSIYPNPTVNSINIDLTGIQAQSVEIFALNGQQLFSTVPTSSMLTISLNNYASGVYFVRIACEEGLIMQKITKID